MENDIRSLTKDLKNYFLQITKADNDNSLTTIQKEKYRDSIKKAIEAKGINYANETHYDAPKRITFYSPTWYVNEIGVIEDVRPNGAYPFSISIDDNISILYDPRNLKDEDRHEWRNLKNNEFLNLQKGSKYRFKGKVSFCNYYFAEKPERFDFVVIGESSLPKKDYCFIATACYGSYDAQQVLELRQFRDEKLLKTFFGKVFVKFYYFVSPFFAAIISKSDLSKKLVRQYFLEPIVTKIQR